MPAPLPPTELLLSLFKYNTETGSLVWRYRPVHQFESLSRAEAWNSTHCNTEAGTEDKHGYKRISISGHGRFQAHRIIYKMMYGFDPDIIDHVDGDPRNNRIENIRSTDSRGNARNLSVARTSLSGARGVSWCKRDKKWRVFMVIDRKYISIGRFVAFEDAVAARREANKKYGFHENHGRPIRS